MPLSQEDQEEIDQLTAEYERLRSTGKWYSPLTPAEQAQWQHKARYYTSPNAVCYYALGPGNGTNIARVMGHEYAYLNQETGEWVRSPSVYDDVVGWKGDSARELTLEEAKRLARKVAPGLRVNWQ